MTREHAHRKGRDRACLRIAALVHGRGGDAARKARRDGNDGCRKNQARVGTHPRDAAGMPAPPEMLAGDEELVGREGVVAGHHEEQGADQGHRRNEGRLPGVRDAHAHEVEKRREHQRDEAGREHVARAERAVRLTRLERQDRGAHAREDRPDREGRERLQPRGDGDERAAKKPQAAHADDEGPTPEQGRCLAPQGRGRQEHAHDGGRGEEVHRAHLPRERDVAGRPVRIEPRARVAQPDPRPPGPKPQVAQVGPLLRNAVHALGIL